MVIITDCLRRKIDEGCIKVASLLSKKIKEQNESTTLVSYNCEGMGADINMKLNPLFLNAELKRLLKQKDDSVLYIPFASNTTASVLRTFVLSLFNKKQVSVLFALRHPMNAISKLILKLSKATVVALSKESFDFYSDILGDKVSYIKTGVDTQKFSPVDSDEKLTLRRKYNLPEDKTLVLHIGHLNHGRNVAKLLELPDDCHGVLVLSSVTKDYRDGELYEKFMQSDKVTVIDEYIENVEQIYNACDVYLFPVLEQGKCIDVPLSVLEAAACNLPVVCTHYGELKCFENKDGFVVATDFSKESLKKLIKQAENTKESARNSVLEYDWSRSVERLA